MKRILVIDDDSSTCEVLELAFSLAGFDVITNPGTEDAFSLIGDLEPDLVLMDYMLKGKDGGEVCRQIKENERTMDLPVILFSACMDIPDPVINYKCDLFIAKPFDLLEMTDQINSLLSQEQVVKH